jgi:aspartate racemase
MTKNGRKTVGVMGGMGPDATVDFMAKVIAMTDSGTDQDHVHMIVDQNPAVPDRQAAIRDGRSDVSDALGNMARGLEEAGADFLVMVCNTAHVFLDGVHASTAIPFISIIEESINAIDELCPGAEQVGVMATTGCLNTGLYQDAVKESGRKALVPEGADMQELMDLIRAIKAGDKGEIVQRGMQASALKLTQRGAEVIIAGCTEIPIVFSGENCSVPVISSTDVLAQRTLELAMGLKPLPGKQ